MEINSLYERLMIVDGSHLLHRSICEPHLWEMKNSDGQRTGGIFGTLQSLQKETSLYQYYPVVVYDGHLSQRRLNLYDNYKRNAEKQLLTENVNQMSELEQLKREQKYEYNQQREILKVLLPNFGIPVIHLSDWEGDDIIYILTQLTKDSIVLSDDKDLLQLVCDESNRKCCVKRGMRNEFIDMNWFKDNDLTIDDFIARKAIVGDPSDNIPSACFQVGEKTAPGLYKLYVESKNCFPKTEEELTKLCKNTNIPKRKAYLNFNEEQFLNNVLLMDLRFVDNYIDNTLLDQIITEIDTSLINTQGIEDLLSRFEITSFNTKELIDKVKILSDFKRLNFDTSNIKDINKIIPGENCSYNSVSAMLFLNN